MTVAPGSALLEEEEDPPTIAVLLSVVVSDTGGGVSAKLEEAGESFTLGVLPSAETFVSGVGVGVTTAVVAFVLSSSGTFETGELAASSTIVVFSVGLSGGGLVTVVSFFWQATPNKATPAIKQRYPFIKTKRSGTDDRLLSRAYGFGDEAGVPVLMVVLVSVLLAGAGDSFTIVVLFSVLFSAGGFVTEVSFCSHAVSNAALASMQM